MASAPKSNNALPYDPESGRLTLSNNMKKALKNSYNAALKQYMNARMRGMNSGLRGNNVYTSEVMAASKLVKNALNVMEAQGVELNEKMKLQKKIHNGLHTMKAKKGGRRGKSKKASRRRMTRRRR